MTSTTTKPAADLPDQETSVYELFRNLGDGSIRRRG